MSYLLLSIILYPLMLAYTIRLALRYRSTRYFKQRLGFSYPSFNDQPIWIHCASVGEVNTFIPLLKQMNENYPNKNFLITTNTVTGAQIVKGIQSGNVHHCYLPLDTPGAVKRFLSQTLPSLSLIMETEIWPQLYHQCHKRNIKLCLINARLSVKTLQANNWIKSQYRKALAVVDHIFCRTQQDQQSFVELGAASQITSVVGNLKFAAKHSGKLKPLDNFTDRKYILAASTHDNEELQLATMWKDLSLKDYLLVIVPRHPERADKILQQLRPLKLAISQRSSGDSIDNNTVIYLADTIGELKSFISNAEIVFMGGSLIPHGGQNLLEPASMGKAVIVGPHMHNFQEEVELFLSRNACIQVDSAEQLADSLKELILNKEKQQGLGEKAKQLFNETSYIADNYIALIKQRYATQLAS